MKSIGIVLMFLMLTSMVFAQDEDDFTPSPELVTYLEGIEQTTSEIRGLESQTSVERFFPTRDDLQAFIDESYTGEENEQLFFEAEQFYIAFDLLSSDIDLMAVYLDFLGDQIAGYYDQETKEMNVVLLSGTRPSDSLPALEQITYSHEYAHALQDQYFDLTTFLPEELAATNPDEAQARLSLVEGDATVVMTEYTTVMTQEAPFSVLLQVILQSGSAASTEGIPEIILNETTSTYLDGASFVQALRAEGGWERVNEAYENPPTSTEQILHPEKYLAGENPIEVALIEDEDALGADWELLFDRTLGEFHLREYLDTQLYALEVIEAGGGWGGDRYRLYYNADTDTRAWILRLEWDSSQDAEQFAEHYVLFGDRRFEDVADENGCWSNDTDAICFAQVDDASLVSYAPTLEQAQRLLQGQLELVTAGYYGQIN